MQVLYKHVRGGGGSEGNAYFAYVKDQKSYLRKDGFRVCEISFKSLVNDHI